MSTKGWLQLNVRAVAINKIRVPAIALLIMPMETRLIKVRLSADFLVSYEVYFADAVVTHHVCIGIPNPLGAKLVLA